jgi:hypothetical protein
MARKGKRAAGASTTGKKKRYRPGTVVSLLHIQKLQD